MLRSIVAILVLSMCTMVSAQQESADASATATATKESAVETASEEPADEEEHELEQESEGKTISSVEAGSGNFRYKMKFKRVAAESEGIECSHGRRTGSHKRNTYCRSETVAKEESDAAREFFLEAMRRKH